ncbi:hypothetical protein [Bartonella tribocorum]|nr:hypothetical protein [Bartonella tribocorum]
MMLSVFSLKYQVLAMDARWGCSFRHMRVVYQNHVGWYEVA